MYPVEDPQALRDPRPDNSYYQGGYTGLQLNQNAGSTEDGFGDPTMGSRMIQWGWNPVGMGFDGGLTPNNLIGSGQVGTVTVSLTETIPLANVAYWQNSIGDTISWVNNSGDVVNWVNT
jgi:hypothetical protein